MAKKKASSVQMKTYLGTLYVSNPTAEIKIGLFATSPNEALDLLNEFGQLAKYPIVDSRIDNHTIIDKQSIDELKQFTENEKQA